MQTSSLIRAVQRVAALAAFAGAASAAHAGGVFWAVNVNAPAYGGGVVGTTISNSPRGLYGAGPVIVAPAPVIVAPQPVYQVGYPRYVEAPRPRWGGHHHHRYYRGYHDGYREGYRDGRDDDDGWRRGERYAEDDDGWRGGRR